MENAPQREEDDGYDWKAHVSIDLIRNLLLVADSVQTLLNPEPLKKRYGSLEEDVRYLLDCLKDVGNSLEGHSLDDLVSIFLESTFDGATLVPNDAGDDFKILLSIEHGPEEKT